jgi:hypothetical protein
MHQVKKGRGSCYLNLIRSGSQQCLELELVAWILFVSLRDPFTSLLPQNWLALTETHSVKEEGKKHAAEDERNGRRGRGDNEEGQETAWP